MVSCIHLNFFLIFSCILNGYAQYVGVIDFGEKKEWIDKRTKRRIRQTKRFLRKWEVYVILDGREVRARYDGDRRLVIEKINDVERELLCNRKILLVQFRRGKSCFYAPLPNGFCWLECIDGLMIYSIYTEIPWWQFLSEGWCKILGRSYYRIDFHIFATGFVVPLIPCEHYNGEFDNEIEFLREPPCPRIKFSN